jgi:hypothetical protein
MAAFGAQYLVSTDSYGHGAAVPDSLPMAVLAE